MAYAGPEPPGRGGARRQVAPVYAHPIETPAPTLDGLLAADDAFYAAFEAGDIDAMSELWDHTDRAACTHPGWSTLHGWAAVAASWFALFQGGVQMQLILTERQAALHGDVGWVTVDENVIAAEGGGTVAALNLYAWDGGRWRMVVHHGSTVAPHH